MCHMHVESPEHAILQCASNLQAHLVHQEFFIHVKQPAFQLVYPLTDNEALTLLKKIIFHWDLVPHIGFLIHHIYLIWSGKEQSGGGCQSRSKVGMPGKQIQRPVSWRMMLWVWKIQLSHTLGNFELANIDL